MTSLVLAVSAVVAVKAAAAVALTVKFRRS
jgi:hypothetical protein